MIIYQATKTDFLAVPVPGHPSGTRQGKIVVVQHRSVDDPETGGSYTVKLYSSEKVLADEGEWRHERITLTPDSTDPRYDAIVLEPGADADSCRIVAEWLAVLHAP